MSEYSNLILDTFNTQRRTAQSAAVGAVDEDPDEAGRALELEASTGTPATAIAGDVEGFERAHKAALASQIIAQNPQLQDYVNSHPLAARVSNDDWGQLDKISQNPTLSYENSPLGHAVKAFKDAWPEQGVGQWISPEQAREYPFLGSVVTGLGIPFEVAARVFNSTIEGVGEGYKQYRIQGGVPENQAEREAREIKAIGEWLAVRGDIPLNEIGPAANLGRKIAPYVAAGKELPPGLHPFVDSILKEQARQEASGLKEALADAQASTTHERAPEFFKNFIDQHTQGRTIGINAEAVAKIDDGTKPEGKLSFIPNLQQQLQSALPVRGDVQVPLADWLAKVDPEVAKELTDDIRLREEGLTVNEAKELPPVKEEPPAVDQTVADIRQRAGLVPSEENLREVFGLAPREAEETGPTPFEPGAIMAKSHQAKYVRLMEEQAAEDAARQTELAERQIRKEKTVEWKERQAKIEDEVRANLRVRPDLAADAFFRGKYYDRDLDIHPTLDSASVTKEQRDALPAGIFSKGGLRPDDVAGLFGFQSGAAMLQRLQMLEAARRQVDMQPKEHFEFLVRDETYREMRAKYGDFDENLLREAQEHVISPTQMDMLHEETMARATKAGVTPAFTKESIRAIAKEGFDTSVNSQHSMEKYLRLAGRAGKAVEDALLKEDFLEAYRQKQLQYFTMLYANEAKKLAKEQDRFDELAKRFSKREVDGVNQENTNWIHDILGRLGLGNVRTLGDLPDRIGRTDNKTFADFVNSRLADKWVMPVAEFLLDPTWKKPVKDLTTEEWRAVAASVRTIAKNGKDLETVERAGAEADRVTTRNEMVSQLHRLGEKDYPPPQTGRFTLRNLAKVYYWAHINLESIFNRWDLGNPKGVFTQTIMRPIAEAMGAEPRMVREYAQRYKDLGDIPNLRDLVESPIKDPRSRVDPNDPKSAVRPWAGFSRDNLAAVIQNMGNGIGLTGSEFRRSNFGKLVAGYGVDPHILMDWVFQHATRADWERAQKMGDIFKDLKDAHDNMLDHLSDVPAAKVPLQPFEVTLPDGTTMTMRGWYHPIRYDPQFLNLKFDPDGLERKGSFTGETAHSWEKERTGFAAPLYLTMDHVPSTMIQMIHDIHFRPPILNALKMFKDPTWRNAVVNHYSKDVADEMIPWLRALMNHADYRTDAEAAGLRTISNIRQNIIGTAVGLNVRTIEKHTLTAGFLSIKEVGLIPWAREFFSQFGHNEEAAESNWKFATDKFDEIARRHQNMNETIYGAHMAQFKSTLREEIMNMASAPIAFFDKASAVPTAMAAYKDALQRGEDEGEAVFEANRAVRRAHGSTALGNRPAIMRGNALAQTFTSIYNFYSAMVQRQFELAWQSREALRSASEGEYKEALGSFTKNVVPGLVIYYVLPTLVEEEVSKQFTEDKRGLGYKSILGVAQALGGGFIGLRDLIFTLESGRDTQLGILNAGLEEARKAMEDVHKGHFDKAHIGKTIEHINTAAGVFTGRTNAQVGRTAEGVINYMTGHDHPKGFGKWYQLMLTGTTKDAIAR